MPLVLVAAVADGGVIGHRGRLPWHAPADLKRFRRITWGKPCILGRVTFEEVGGALEGRPTVVLTRRPGYRAEGCLVVPDAGEAEAIARGIARATRAEEVCVLGGSRVFARFLPRAARLVLTRVHGRFPGDRTFPPLPPGAFREVQREEVPAGPGSPVPLTFLVLERIIDY